MPRTCTPGARPDGGGAPAAWINLAGFASLVFNLLFVNLVSTGLHSYGGV